MQVRIVGGHGGLTPDTRMTSYLIDGKLLIDAGSVASGLKIDEQALIENILISHSHLDHIAELGYLCDNCFGLLKKPFDVYSCEEVKNSLLNHVMNDYIWPDFSKIPSVENPIIRFHALEMETVSKIGSYKVTAVKVNHPAGGTGFIVEKGKQALLFTLDTAATDQIWNVAKNYPNLKAIFTEVSFPNSMQKLADLSCHHTPNSLKKEMSKMPADVPIFIGHLKPAYQAKLVQEIEDIGDERITVMASDNLNFVF